MLGLLLAILAAWSILEDKNGTGAGGRDVIWSNFQNFMLETGYAKRIVVVNTKEARVYLPAGARGEPEFWEHGGAGGVIGSVLGSGRGLQVRAPEARKATRESLPGMTTHPWAWGLHLALAAPQAMLQQSLVLVVSC